MLERIQRINELIKLISEQERTFFLNKDGNGLIANFRLTEGLLFYQDEWKGEIREITKRTDWVKISDWVSHGSGIRQQIIEFSKFIFTGESQKMLSRYWGISFESQVIIHKKAHEIGFIEGNNGFIFHDYKERKDRYCCDECGINEAFSKCEKGTLLCSMCESVHYHYTHHKTEPITAG
jgi:hypothetical protein